MFGWNEKWRRTRLKMQRQTLHFALALSRILTNAVGAGKPCSFAGMLQSTLSLEVSAFA